MLYEVTRILTLKLEIEASTGEDAIRETDFIFNDMDCAIDKLEDKYPEIIDEDVQKAKSLEVDRICLKADRRYDEIQDGEV